MRESFHSLVLATVAQRGDSWKTFSDSAEEEHSTGISSIVGAYFVQMKIFAKLVGTCDAGFGVFKLRANIDAHPDCSPARPASAGPPKLSVSMEKSKRKNQMRHRDKRELPLAARGGRAKASFETKKRDGKSK